MCGPLRRRAHLPAMCRLGSPARASVLQAARRLLPRCRSTKRSRALQVVPPVRWLAVGQPCACQGVAHAG